MRRSPGDHQAGAARRAGRDRQHAHRITEEEARILWPKVNAFVRAHGEPPSVRSDDAQERRMAEALLFLQRQRRAGV